MVTSITLLLFFAFYLLYSNSKRMHLANNFGFEHLIEQHPVPVQFLGIFLLAVSVVFFVLLLGNGSGIFVFFIVLMTMGSLTVLLAPLRVLHLKSLSLTFAFFLILELLML